MIVVQRARLGTLLGYVGKPLVALFALDVAVVVAYVFGGWNISLPDIPVSVVGGVIGVIAGFRNASAYARWWEARTIWGGLVNHSRNFAREVLTMIAPANAGDPSEMEIAAARHELIFLQIAYIHALRHQLRGTAPWIDLAGLVPQADIDGWKAHYNVPLAIQLSIAEKIAQYRQLGWLDDIRWANLDRTLCALMDCQGASERIKNTPLPRLYDLFVRLFIGGFCALLPFGMVQSLRFLTPIGSTLVGFMFLALDQIGRDLENPFENLPNDISLTAISRNVEINLEQMLGIAAVPEPLKPINGVLW